MFHVVSVCYENSLWGPTTTHGIYTAYPNHLVDITDGSRYYASEGDIPVHKPVQCTTRYGISCDANHVATLESYVDGVIYHSCMIAEYLGWSFSRRPCQVEYDDGEIRVLCDSGRRIMIRYDKM